MRSLMRSALAAGGLVLLAACGGEPTAAEAMGAKTGGNWTADYSASRLGFSGVQTGKTFEGSFGRYDAVIDFHPEDLAASSIKVTVDMASARTGDRQRDAALPDEDWFHVASAPMASFVSTEIEEAGEGAYVAHGTLTIRGNERPVDLPFSLSIEGDAARAAGALTLIRTDYDVGQGEFSTGEWVGLEVRVFFEIEAKRK